MKAPSPYLFFNGDCALAMNFYKGVFGGELTLVRYGDAPADARPPEADPRHIMHARLQNDAFVLLGSDMHEGDVDNGNDIQLHQEFAGVEEFDRAFKLLSQGGKVFQQPNDAPWGSRFAMLTDKFRFSWMLSAPLPPKKEGEQNG